MMVVTTCTKVACHVRPFGVQCLQIATYHLEDVHVKCIYPALFRYFNFTPVLDSTDGENVYFFRSTENQLHKC